MIIFPFFHNNSLNISQHFLSSSDDNSFSIKMLEIHIILYNYWHLCRDPSGIISLGRVISPRALVYLPKQNEPKYKEGNNLSSSIFIISIWSARPNIDRTQQSCRQSDEINFRWRHRNSYFPLTSFSEVLKTADMVFGGIEPR